MLDGARYIGLGRDRSELLFGRKSVAATHDRPKISVKNLNFWYGRSHALKDVSLDIQRCETTALIGPSGCGKSTFIKCLNRMHDEVPGARLTGDVLIDGVDVYGADIDPPLLRRRFGWVAQKPNPFPWSVYDNIAYGIRLHGMAEFGGAIPNRAMLDEAVQLCLARAGLWEELKDRLHEPGTDLSGGQQQRLCIARALSISPEVLLMDEPCGSLDPISTERIEALIETLSETLSIVIVTHNMEQAARVSQKVAFFKLGEVLEAGPTRESFVSPQCVDFEEYLSGQFG